MWTSQLFTDAFHHYLIVPSSYDWISLHVQKISFPVPLGLFWARNAGSLLKHRIANANLRIYIYYIYENIRKWFNNNRIDPLRVMSERLESIFSKRKVWVFAEDKRNNVARVPETDKTEDKAKICLNKNRSVFI